MDETAKADTTPNGECLAYARGYAQGVEDTASYRIRAEEAEREVERLKARQQNGPLAGE